jgi:hypothetical protein
VNPPPPPLNKKKGMKKTTYGDELDVDGLSPDDEELDVAVDVDSLDDECEELDDDGNTDDDDEEEDEGGGVNTDTDSDDDVELDDGELDDGVGKSDGDDTDDGGLGFRLLPDKLKACRVMVADVMGLGSGTGLNGGRAAIALSPWMKTFLWHTWYQLIDHKA